MKYYFVLGNNPTLSALEIAFYFQREKIDHQIIGNSNEILLLETKKEIDAEKILDSLGGTIKIGKIIAEQKPNQTDAMLILKFLIHNSRFLIPDSKINFGFSQYALSKSSFRLPANFGFELKKLLKEKNISSRFVISRDKNLSSVVVTKNLLGKGAEFCFIDDKDKVYIGETLAVQKFAEYSARDYGRPGRDAVSGMLPPKLAKIMLTLSRISVDESGRTQILDPFCGSGTILQEAILLGYKNLIGSDISERAIADTKKNLEFITKKLTNLPTYQLINLSATDLISKIKPNSINAIITEPFLGPPLRGGESREKIQKILAELSELYLKSFTEFKKILKPDGKIVIVFPAFKFKNEILYLPVLNQLKKEGFNPSFEIPAELKNLNLTPRHSIIYSRPDQKVMREIFIFTIDKN